MKHHLIERFQEQIMTPEFKNSHRKKPSDFTRTRKLPFSSVIFLVLQKSVKSVQLVLNEWCLKLDLFQTVTCSAFLQARKKLSHTAFIELNQSCVIRTFYESPKENQKRWKDFRLLGIDGSQIRYPESESVRDHFGSVPIKNQYTSTASSYAMGFASVCYDLLNNLTLEASLEHARSYEVDHAMKHVSSCIKQDDLTILDRGTVNTLLFALFMDQEKQFLCRSSRNTFAGVKSFFSSTANDKIVTLKVPAKKRNQALLLDLPLKIRVRLVKVILPSGEVEVLITSLTDRRIFKLSDFKDLYYQRWGIETYYGLIKGRLDLENFTGTSAESVLQDFHATLLISGIESIFTKDSEKILEKQSETCQNDQSVNKAVSFNALKNQLFDILFTEKDSKKIIQKLDAIFLLNPNIQRKQRSPPREKSHSISSLRRKIGFLKRRKKVCF